MRTKSLLFLLSLLLFFSCRQQHLTWHHHSSALTIAAPVEDHYHSPHAALPAIQELPSAERSDIAPRELFLVSRGYELPGPPEDEEVKVIAQVSPSDKVSKEPVVKPAVKKQGKINALSVISLALAVLSILTFYLGLMSLSNGFLFLSLLLGLSALTAGIMALMVFKVERQGMQELAIVGMVTGSLVILLSGGLISLLSLFDALF